MELPSAPVKKFRLYFFLPVVLTGLALLVTYRTVEKIVNTLPAGSPETCATGDSAGGPRVLVLGDSLTLGRISADYVGLLRERQRSLRFINAGINGDTAAMARDRLLPALTRCRPRAMLILLGTNDVNKLKGRVENARFALSSAENPDSFRSSLRAILERARASGVPHLAVYSIPPIGEDLTDPANDLVRIANANLEEEARAANTQVLPLFDQMRKTLDRHSARTACANGRAYVELAAFQRYLLGRSWDEISSSMGFALTTDCLHLNDRAANLMADLAEPFLAQIK